MNWSEFIQYIEDGNLGRRYSDLELQNVTGVKREIIYKLRTGKTKSPQQSTIDDLEKGLEIKIDASDPDNITFKSFSVLRESLGKYSLDVPTEEEMKILKRCKELGIDTVYALDRLYENAKLGDKLIVTFGDELKERLKKEE